MTCIFLSILIVVMLLSSLGASNIARGNPNWKRIAKNNEIRTEKAYRLPEVIVS